METFRMRPGNWSLSAKSSSTFQISFPSVRTAWSFSRLLTLFQSMLLTLQWRRSVIFCLRRRKRSGILIISAEKISRCWNPCWGGTLLSQLAFRWGSSSPPFPSLASHGRYFSPYMRAVEGVVKPLCEPIFDPEESHSEFRTGETTCRAFPSWMLTFTPCKVKQTPSEITCRSKPLANNRLFQSLSNWLNISKIQSLVPKRS